jgi:hypothetical protein
MSIKVIAFFYCSLLMDKQAIFGSKTPHIATPPLGTVDRLGETKFKYLE